MDQAENSYYDLKRSEFFEQFHEFLMIIMKLIGQKYGKDFADKVEEEIREKYESIYEEIPYIGGDRNPLTSDLVSAAMDLAVYVVLKKHGKKLEDIGEIAYKTTQELFKIYPEAADMPTNPEYIPYFKMGAQRSAERKFSEDWVYSFCEGDGDFDFGLDFTECAIQKFFHKYDAHEFTPFLCAMDILMSETANAGLHRKETLAEGGSKCDFRYKKGRETRVLNTVIKKY